MIGLIPDREDARSILNVQIRDPQVNMVSGDRPSLRLADRPLTQMAATAVQGQSGVDVDGYRDYRGVPVVGAWTWLPEFGIGVATEMDVAEAYRPAVFVALQFLGLFALLIWGHCHFYLYGYRCPQRPGNASCGD